MGKDYQEKLLLYVTTVVASILLSSVFKKQRQLTVAKRIRMACGVLPGNIKIRAASAGLGGSS